MKRPQRGLIYKVLRTLLYPWICRVRLLQADVRELKQLSEQGQLVFVGTASSFIDFLIVNDQLKRNDMQPIAFTHGFTPFLVLPFKDAFNIWSSRLFKTEEVRAEMNLEDLAADTAAGGNGFVFLKKGARFLGTRVHYFHGYFGKVAKQTDRNHKTFFIPTSVFLTRFRKKNVPRTLNDIFFGTYDIPGRPRKLFQLLVNYHKGGTIYSKHIDLDAELEKVGEVDEAKADKRLRWTLLFHLNNEDRAYRGPNKRSRSRKVRKILKEKRLQMELKQVAERTDRSIESVLKEADKTLHDIASDTSERVINIMRILFDFVWARTLEDIDFRQEDIDRLRQLNKEGPVVIMPCHRSHVDYLVVAYVMEKQGLNYPRTAAGDNLSKWPLGALLRRCGAFFLRRSFKGEAVFPLVFDAYIRHILRERHAMIFFTEGGRSRTGKLLHPKLGLMSMILDAWRQGIVKDLPLVPVTLDYGKVFEGQSYLREKSGEPKRKEDLRSVLSSRKVLKKKHGVLRLRFGEPIYLAQYVADQGFEREKLGFKNKMPLLHNLGYRVLNEVNNNVTLTAGNVVANLLMGNPRRGMTLEDLRALFLISVRYLRHKNAEVSFSEQKLDIALENALHTFEEWETLVRVDVGGKTVVNIPEPKRPEMEYYKNNGLHFVLDHALFSMAFLCLPDEQRTLADIGEFAREVYDFLRQEFIITEEFPTDEDIEKAYKAMARIEALQMDGETVIFGTYRVGCDLVRIAGYQLLNFLESYFVVAETLTELSEENQPDQKQFLKQCLVRAKLLYAVGMMTRKESINHVSFGNALKRFNKYGFVQLRNIKGQKHPQVQFNEKKREQFEAKRAQLFEWIETLS
ncbi:MAG: 1-acyl-sn-glycerol-3-phosphate acyltransferase [Acidobacteriota bacterium]|nr:1-acyl-sn-glycerol-3-phosphate acyltransferase [Acidobacteriota bacterium]